MIQPIAVVGIACRYPDASSPEELWENALAGRRAFRRIPDERLRLEDYWSADPAAPDKFYARKAAVIEGFEFDRVKYKIAGSTFRTTDMTHWLALDTAARALEDAGFADGDGMPKGNTTVIVGNSLTGEFTRANLMRLRWPYVRRTLGAALKEIGWDDDKLGGFLASLEARYKSSFPPVDEDTLAGGLSNTIAGRICNQFDFKGGGFTVDGACSSSLLAVVTGCAALSDDITDAALVGGVDLSIDPFEIIGFAKTGALAASDMRVYDRHSNGFWPGEGCGMLVLMRLQDAEARGLRVYATIAGWGYSSDGKGGITRPEAAGHKLALSRAYRLAGFDISTVGYLEGHGTGTAVGDATELQAFTEARREAAAGAPAVAIGTIKGNIGHTKAAAGVAGLIKATMAVHHQVIPPASGHVDPHPLLVEDSPALRVPLTAEVWPEHQPIRAGVSAMGFGGINAHVILAGDDAIRRTGLDARTIRLVSSRQDSGFEQFTTLHNDGYSANNGAGGNGQYAQTIDANKLGQGYHYITVEAFTFRNDSGPAIYTDWKQTIYIDLAPPNSTATSFNDVVAGANENRNLLVTSVDGLANNVHTFLDLPFGLTDAQVLAQVSSSTQATQQDTNLWQHNYTGVTSGNHTVTVVSYKPDGNYNIQRFNSTQDPYLSTSTAIGLGIGDLTHDGTITSADISSLTSVVVSNNGSFNAAADVNGDGLVDLADTFLLGPVLSANNVATATWTSYNNFINSSYVATHTYTVNGTNVIYQDTAGTTNVSSGAILNATYVRGNALNISANGFVQIQSNPTFGNGTSKVLGLLIAGTTGAWTGKLDLTNNAMVVESTTGNQAADLARITSMLSQGFDSGKWDGSGIDSSMAESDTAHLHALGVIVNSAGTSSALYPAFYGQTADANAILISYTIYGDSNLDGHVDSTDYSRIDNGFVLHLTGWANGDYDYDGTVNGSDYTLIDNAFNTQGAYAVQPNAITNPTAIITSEVARTTPVPEPTTLTMVTLGLWGLLGRRRKGKLVL